MKNVFITTPIFYVNDLPHIGHAYTGIATDILARWNKLSGKNVFCLTGTDEHGQKVESSAIAKNIDVMDYCTYFSDKFRHLAKDIKLQNDDFIRTTEVRHKTFAQKFWTKLEENGWIYRGVYEGWYSVRDESFYTDSEVSDGKAYTGSEVEWRKEDSYFFRLSEAGKALESFYSASPSFIFPKTRFNEIKSFVGMGLKDLSVSRRNLKWGIPVPSDESHTIYVWLDALTNYLSALDIDLETIGNSEDFKAKFWNSDTRKIHVVGKDILRFHSVYWLAFLFGVAVPFEKRFEQNSLELASKIYPTNIVAHGWWTNEGEKISKSIGNVINPYDLLEKYGLDRMRYYLISSVPFGGDGDFKEDEFVTKTNSDLSNNFGNLVQRIMKIVYQNLDGHIPEFQGIIRGGESFPVFIIDTFTPLFEGFLITDATKKLVSLGNDLNKIVDDHAPWVLVKNGNTEELKKVLGFVCHYIFQLIDILSIFCPDAGELFSSFVDKKSMKTNSPVALFTRV